jgi:hypothetical protein
MILIESLFSDAVPTVLAAEWDAYADLFDGEQAKGPVPRLFALNPEEARENLCSNPERAHKDLQRIYGRLGVTENIPPSSAFDFVINPR